MRLFIALCFAPAMVEALDALAADLQREAGGGRRTRRENLHLTLAFLGEQQSSAPWAEAVAAAEGCAMRLESGRLGCVRRSGGELWWLGLRQQPQLQQLAASLAAALQQRGFAPEPRPFRPHITLLREASLPPDFDAAAFLRQRWPRPLVTECSRLSLMLSQREQGVLVYRELFARTLPPG